MLLSYNPLWLRIGLEVNQFLNNHLICLLLDKLFVLFFFLVSHPFSHFALFFSNFTTFLTFFCFQTIYGEILPIQSNYDVTGLSRFLRDRLLNNPDIAEAFAHSQVPGLYREGRLLQHLRHHVYYLHYFWYLNKTKLLLSCDFVLRLC